MFTVEKICEEQERQYNQLMEEDDQYCHPESFKWGFEHGVEYALTKAGWHPASELPPVNEDGRSDLMVVIRDNKYCTYYKEPISLISQVVNGRWIHEKVKWWCYPPEED